MSETRRVSTKLLPFASLTCPEGTPDSRDAFGLGLVQWLLHNDLFEYTITDNGDGTFTHRWYIKEDNR